MSEEHNVDDTGNAERTASVNRRRFVQALGTTGLATAGLSSVATAQTSSKAEDVDITNLSGSSRRNALSSALSDDKTKKIRHELTKSGWKQNVNDAQCVLSEPSNGKPHRVVLIPFEPTDSKKNQEKPRDEQVSIRWLDRVPTGAEIERVTGKRITELDRDSKHGISTKTVTYNIESNEVVSSTSYSDDHSSGSETSDEKISPQDNIAPPGGNGGDYCQQYECERDIYECDSTNWHCVGVIAGAYAGTIGACAACSGSGWSCLICLAAVDRMRHTKFTCDVGNGCRTIHRCVPCCAPDPPNGCA